jgi:exopolyphosphatase/guanosine-5'-triphosphate,3'-diphosphate pyrophosphatase
MRRAVIDVGTNTVKLLVADVDGGHVTPVSSLDHTTRLGEGVDESRRLLGAAIARTVQAISDFVNEAHRSGTQDVIVLTTSAVREAENRSEFLDGVRCKCGLEVQVITGEREAELIFHGVSSDPEWSTQPLLVVDVGGGSVEFIQGARGKVERLQSLPLGAVRLAERYGDDFVELAGFLRRTLHESLTGYDGRRRRVIGTGGTMTTLAQIELGRADHVSFSQAQLRALVARLNVMPLAERKKVPGLPPERADIIVAGGMVFVVAMELLGAEALTVSVRNLRYGALLSV